MDRILSASGIIRYRLISTQRAREESNRGRNNRSSQELQEGKAGLKAEEAAYTVFDGNTADTEDASPDSPVIVAEMSVDIPESTVSDAVMLMDLRNTPALLFKNTGTGRHNMVYRREDGTIGWVEPKSAP